MPSITYWNRLEPRARSNDFARALAARVRDPAWFLARQWQLGEFQGEDAASPAYVKVTARTTPFVGVGTPPIGPGGPQRDPQVLEGGRPVDSAIGAEPFPVEDLTLAVELGRWFEVILSEAPQAVAELLPAWRGEFPIGDAPTHGEPARGGRLRALWKGRVIDGIALYVAGKQPPEPSAPPPGVPASVTDPNLWEPAGQVVQAFVELCERRFGATGSPENVPVGTQDPYGWDPERLDHEARVYGGVVNGEAAAPATFAAHPDREGDLEWFGFDEIDPVAEPSPFAPPTVTVLERTVMPGRVRFRGMPAARFWEFEDGRVHFGGLRPDRRDLASLILADFMLVHGTDWFLVPFEQPVGTLCTTSELVVVDVFGDPHPIDTGQGPGWSMFATRSHMPEGIGDYFVIPHSASAAVEEGPILEDVRFLRDETANLAWAIEHATAGTLGTPWPGAERLPAEAPAPSELTATAPLVYRLQTRVPPHWIPFQPVKLPNSDEIALQRAELLPMDGPEPAPIGKILRPEGVDPEDYQIREEEIPREGRRVTRVVRRVRHDHGSYLWIARKRGVGTGEGASDLRFDLTLLADQIEPAEPEEPGTPLEWDEPPGWDDADWT